MFNEDKKRFYQMIMNKNVIVQNPPSAQTAQQFWSNLWSVPAVINHGADWMEKEFERFEDTEKMMEFNITHEDFIEAIQNTQNWKAPGWDSIQNFWLKKLTSCHDVILNEFNKYLQNPDETPTWLTLGNTYLIPKNEKTEDVKCYRPITCLPVLYKLLTSIIKTKMYKHLTENNILPMEQRGCLEGANGCKDLLLLDKIITDDCKKKKKDLSIAWIDLMKAYDNVSHEWIVKLLHMYKVDEKVINFCEKTMKMWRTRLIMNTQSDQIITVKRGLYQGDSYSSLWFCLAINPLSTILNTLNTGYKMEGMKITHLLFMDDLKLFASSVVNLKKMISVVHDFSEDIQMKFGLDKCKILNMIRGKHSTDPDEIVSPKIEQMNETEVYRYLGINQNVKIDHTKLKNEFKETYSMRLEKVLKTKLNSTNLIKAINSWAIASLSYTYGILKWSQTDLETLDRLTRTTMTKHRVHHPRACVERLYVPRRNGGRGLLNIQKLHNAQVIKMKNYFNNSDNPMHEILRNNNFDYLALKQDHEERFSNNNEYVNQAVDTWKKKTLHGKYPQLLDEPKIHKENSITYLRKGELYPETEGFITAIQDSVIATKNHQKFIFKTITDDKCRLCKEKSETIEHVIGSCKILAKNEYLNRHNQVAKIIYSKIIIQNKIKDYVEPYYKLNPEPVLENDQFKILWDRQIITDKTIDHNKPDIVFQNKATEETILIEVEYH
ncbi:hypothetical protein WDU94_008911 [Cyamophila willieti]